MNLDAHGAAALVLAVGLSLSILVLSIGVIIHEGPVSLEESSLLSAVLGAAVGALATYLGGLARHDHDDGSP